MKLWLIRRAVQCGWTVLPVKEDKAGGLESRRARDDGLERVHFYPVIGKKTGFWLGEGSELFLADCLGNKVLALTEVETGCVVTAVVFAVYLFTVIMLHSLCYWRQREKCGHMMGFDSPDGKYSGWGQEPWPFYDHSIWHGREGHKMCMFSVPKKQMNLDVINYHI